ncbi:MAG: hypothetical protein KatS3mg011_1076 [Acidimicrobiia bacterium]|nr:MAG: hypothetical protein KatS3mg011_1076 [Acidimicrobiia bacterium]
MSTLAPVPTPPVRPHAASGAGAHVAYLSGRPMVRAWPYPIDDLGLDPHQLRRFWVAAVGPGPVEDLMRLISAAHRRKPLRLPRWLDVLLEERVAHVVGRVVWVPSGLPPLPRGTLTRLSPAIRRRYLEWLRSQLCPR